MLPWQQASCTNLVQRCHSNGYTPNSTTAAAAAGDLNRAANVCLEVSEEMDLIYLSNYMNPVISFFLKQGLYRATRPVLFR